MKGIIPIVGIGTKRNCLSEKKNIERSIMIIYSKGHFSTTL